MSSCCVNPGPMRVNVDVKLVGPARVWISPCGCDISEKSATGRHFELFPSASSQPTGGSAGPGQASYDRAHSSYLTRGWFHNAPGRRVLSFVLLGGRGSLGGEISGNSRLR